MSLWTAMSAIKGTYQSWKSKRGGQGARGEGILQDNRPSIVERQRRLTPFNDFGSQYLLPTDPPHLSWSDGSLEPFEEKIVEGEWELQVDAASTDADGWNYAFNWEFVFHPDMTSKDLVRKRIWRRRRHDEVERLPDHRGGILGCLRVSALTPEEEGAVQEMSWGMRQNLSEPADEVECMHALFGVPVDLEGLLVWAKPETAHEDIENPTELCGNIALLRRDPPAGDGRPRTGFVDKAFRAVAAGARAVVVVNTCDDLLAPWVWSHDLMDADQVKVPVVCVRAHDEATLRPGAFCQLSFRVRRSADSLKRSSADNMVGGEGEWEWSETASSGNEVSDDEGEEQDTETWMQQSKQVLQHNARWLASLASSSVGQTHSRGTDPCADQSAGRPGEHGADRAREGAGGQEVRPGVAEWAVDDDGGGGWDGEPLPATGLPLASNVHKDLRELHEMLEDNLKFFTSCPEQTLRHYKRCSEVCVAAIMTLQDVGSLVQGVAAVATMHDVSKDVPGNGYWAQLRVLSCCLKKMKKKLHAIGGERDSVFFGTRVKSLLHGLSSYHRILVILKALLHTTLVFRRDDLDHHQRLDNAGLDAAIPREQGDGGASGTAVKRRTEQAEQLFEAEDAADAKFSALTQKAVLARQLGSSGPLADDDSVTRLDFAPGDQVADLGLLPGQVEEEAGRSLFLDSITMQDVEARVRQLDLSVLYGEVHGYQYPARLKHFLRVILLAAAGYSRSFEDYADDSIYKQLASAYFHGVKFLIKPAKKSQRLAQQFREGDIKFVKSFWNLTELPVATKFGAVVGAAVEVCRKITIDGSHNILMPISDADTLRKVSEDNEQDRNGRDSDVVWDGAVAFVSVSIRPSEEECRSYCPEGYVAPAEVSARLISHRTFEGQEAGCSGERDQRATASDGKARAGAANGATGGGGSKARFQGTFQETLGSIHMPSMTWKNKAAPMSPFLIIHFHGGGFIAQSSASHEVYLRDWAKTLDAPILSIDYDLAPEHPFPVAVCQSFYAYCWAIKNAHLLGSTAQSVICVGDSAGGNLAAVVALRALEEGIRPPCGVVMIYPALYLHMTPCASRVLSLMDPLLPLGTLQLCMVSYAHRFQALHGEVTAALHKHHIRTELASSESGGARGDGVEDPLMAKTGIEHPCGNGCDGDDAMATHWCKQCVLPICSVCVMMHRRQKMTRGHELQELKGHEARMNARTRKRIHHLSPLVAPRQLLERFPSCAIMASELDPLLDDSVMFTRRLKALGRESDVRLKVAPLLPHGWLNMYFTGDQGSMSASTEATCWMKQMLQNGLGEVCRAEGGAEGAAFADAAQHAMTEVEGALWMPGEGLTTPSAVRSALRSDSEAGSDVSPSTPSDRVEVDWARGDVFLSGAPRA